MGSRFNPNFSPKSASSLVCGSIALALLLLLLHCSHLFKANHKLDSVMSETSINFGPQWLRAQSDSSSKMSSRLASMRLAQHRYGREEMLAIFEAMDNAAEGAERNDDAFISFPFLWRAETQTPVNLGTLDEEEARTWQRGANSDASLRIYNNGGNNNSNLGLARGGPAFRGRGRGRGFERGGFVGHGFAQSNGWYGRPPSSGGPENLELVRKPNSRAPVDDWRKSSSKEEVEPAGWRNNGQNRRWNNAPAVGGNSWRSDNLGRGRGLPERGGWLPPRGSVRGRGGSLHQRLPEWAKEDEWNNDDEDRDDGDGDQFDDEGNFHKGGTQKRRQGSGEERGLYKTRERQVDHDEDEVEEVDPDDLKEAPDVKLEDPLERISQREERRKEEVARDMERISDGSILSNQHVVQEHLDAGHFVSKLVDEEEEELKETPPKDLDVNKQVNLPSERSSDSSPGMSAKAEATKWLYLDPQGNVQGPFDNESMLEWFTGGFFPSDLRLRRITDEIFIPLNKMTELYGRVPFLSASNPNYCHSPPPLTRSRAYAMTENDDEQRLAMAQMLLLRQQQQREEERKQRENHILQLAAQQQAANRPAFPSLGGLFPHLQQPPQPNLLNNHPIHPNPTSSLFPNMVGGPSENPLKALLDRNIGVANKEENARQQLDFPGFSPTQPSVTTSAGLGVNTSASLFPQTQSVHEPFGSAMRQGVHSERSDQQQPAFDPIKSLLSQLDSSSRAMATNQEEMLAHHQRESPVQSQQRPQSRPSSAEQQGGLTQHQVPRQAPSIWETSEPKPMISQESIWGTNEKTARPLSPERASESVWNEPAEENKPQETQIEQRTEVSQVPMEDREVQDEAEFVTEGFVIPKTSEKREKKTKKAEERKRQREAKQLAEQAKEEASRYIPGISADRPKSITEEEALAMLNQQAEQKRGQESLKEEQQRETPKPSKLAPWANKGINGEGGDNRGGNTLGDIQRMEMERLRKEQRENEALQRKKLEEEEKLRQQQQRATWAQSASGYTKSLAEIQAEEEMLERKRLEKERKEQEARQRELKRMPENTSVWAASRSNISWASKASKNAPTPSAPPVIVPVQQAAKKTAAPPPQAKPKGLWDDPTPRAAAAPPQEKASITTSKKNSKSKKAKEDERVASIFKEKRTPLNEFETWCQGALEELHAQVDIPTFMAFLKDIDSPYEVHDYIKSYVGEGRGAKHFAKEYVERRSKYRNALKSSQRRQDDDLLKPAAAINPNEDLPVTKDQSTAAPAATGQKGKKAKSKKGRGNDASHLLGFNVTASTNRFNIGEIDTPNM